MFDPPLAHCVQFSSKELYGFETETLRVDSTEIHNLTLSPIAPAGPVFCLSLGASSDYA